MWACVSRLETAAVYICISDEMPGRGYTPQSPQAAWHTVSLLSYSLSRCKSWRFSKAFGRRGPDRRRLASPIQHTPLVLLYLRRLLDASRGGGRAGATAPGFAAAWRLSPLFPARLSSTGVSGCENRLRAMYMTSATPSSGLAETPSEGCGKYGFFLRLSHLLNYRNNSAAVLLSCGVVGSFPASLMDGSAPCCRWSLTISARPQNTAICNGVSPSLFQAFEYAPRLRRVSRLRRRPQTPPSGVQLFISGV